MGLFAAEILLVYALSFIYSKRETIELNYTQDDMMYNNNESGSYLDGSYDRRYVVTPGFSLPNGFYMVAIQYESSNTAVAAMSLHYSYGAGETDITGPIIINPDSSEAFCDFRVKYDDREIQLRARLTDDAAEEDYLRIVNVNIITSPLSIRNFIFKFVVCLLAIDLLILLYRMKDKFHINEERQTYFKILLLLIFISSIPLMVNYLFNNAHDLKFHLMRIEGIQEGLMYGMFPVKIQPGWMVGHGYATSVFYGDILLYIPAILRIFGVSIQTSYQFYILLINAITVFTSYYCFLKMSNARIGLICAVVYTLNIYRLANIYTRAAVGEYTAMVFIPLILYGLWKIYTLPEESKEHQKSWIPITIGCCGIFLSHIITTEMTAVFVILTAVIMWKKTFRKKNFLVLVKSAAATLLLNCWFLVPFLDYMLTGSFLINSPNSFGEYAIENESIFPSQFFMIDYSVTGLSRGAYAGTVSEMPLTVGLSALTVLVGWFLLCFGKKERNKAEKKAEYFAVFLSVVSLWMTTNLFPYTWMANKLSILKMPVRSIQYSWRFLAIAGLMLVYLLCMILQKEWIKTRTKRLFAGLLIVLSFGQGISYMSQCLNEFEASRIYQEGNLSTFETGNKEYLPINEETELNVSKYANQLTYDNSEITVENWYRDNGAVVVSLTNNRNETAQMEVPLLFYKGYHAVTDSGEELFISLGTSSRISVSVPADFTGSFRVEFKEPWYWRFGEIISLLTLLTIVLYQAFKYNSGRKNVEKTLFKR